ncbi:hypothetical protein M441DRAFT_58285 [Trichoderma asperellum CBS 433.97]|uniref:Uncharacterized protein n=1 Tax=Trichoderma asperellum (strain ATCC 204424 / CBS 433.97 / NBRC 101777) TaxID=1042311 RepID=A0A2T3Z7M0_TRIA4|nr:hypothetical protein M441DRAFT_58285 [Trichoderma asperellum CBS 433.97]PTB40809.1 hypothetical protein M441DRAFT_58285 [Trichoderma asperellum CBS 433.97]
MANTVALLMLYCAVDMYYHCFVSITAPGDCFCVTGALQPAASAASTESLNSWGLW